MAGSHVDGLQLQSTLKKFSPTNLANQFVQSALTVSLALATLVALARYAAGRPAGHANGGQSLDQATHHKHGRRSELVDAFEKSKSSTNQFPKIGKRRSCVCALFSSIYDVSFLRSRSAFFVRFLLTDRTSPQLLNMWYPGELRA